MAVEFALRPRIRLREEVAPSRRSRLRVPKYAAPVAAYWLAVAGISYGYIRSRNAQPTAAPSDHADFAAAPAAGTARPWWRLEPSSSAAPTSEFERAALPVVTAPRLVPASPAVAALVAPTAPSPMLLPEPRLDSRPAPVRSSERTQEARAAAELEPQPSSPSAGGLPSCEAAIATQSQDVDFSQSNRAADLPSQSIGAVLENGAWFASCQVPASTSLEVCVAIRNGRVVGASVMTRPADPALSRCVRQRAAGLQFPFSARLDVARTRF